MQLGAILFLAWRNVLRNSRRSALTCVVMALGLTFVFAARGLLSGLQQEIVTGITKSDLGEIQIVKRGFFEALPSQASSFYFDDTDELRKQITGIPGVSAISARLTFGGMINHQKNQVSTPFVAMAVDPVSELAVCPRATRTIVEGAFLRAELERDAQRGEVDVASIEDAATEEPIDFSKPVGKESAHNLAAESGGFHQLMLGEVLVRGMLRAPPDGQGAVRLGDELVLLTQDKDGGQHSLVTTLTGVVSAPNPTASKLKVLTSLPTIQKLINADGKVTQLVLALKTPSVRFSVRDQLNTVLKARNLEAVTWDQIQPFFVSIMDLQNAIYSVVMAVIVLIVIVAIVITTFMAVSERTREIGTLMAIGYRRRLILWLFLFESALLGLAGGMLGILGGTTLVGILNRVGITFYVPGTEYPMIIHPAVTPFFAALTLAIGVLASLAGSYYPARRASHFTPLEALAHI